MTPDPNRKANRLIDSTSPYLLQHAYNPVEWFEWKKEALEKAKKEDKPILVSIGYSSCHWCHVMERESFENEDIAQLMNEHYVCIKVDREERPDIDHIYMEAVQAMGQNGGWPLNVFLTPDQKPFYGGTYFSPQNWAQLLFQIQKVFREKRNEINQSASDLSDHLRTSDLQRFAKEPRPEAFLVDALDTMFQLFSKGFDQKWGGMEKAPKFVMPTIWMFLLRHYSATKNKESLHMVELTLRQMAYGGLYDQIGGGFSRYSVDGEWFAPHFEKMLYDNAQLLTLYAEAFAVTNLDLFKNVVKETTQWLQREMLHPDGGFYSALDADSEGIEGKFYTWTLPKIKEAVGNQGGIVAEYFHVTENGNWEHGRNILKIADNEEHFTKAYGMNNQDLHILISSAKSKMLQIRNTRIHPGLDNKVLTGWNAMLIKGLTDAYRAWGDELFLTLAVKNMSFIENSLISDGRVFRAFKNKKSDTEGFLEDYAFLIQAYTALYQVTCDEAWLQKAEKWCSYVLKNFHDESDGYFHFSSKTAEQLIAQKKEIFDNVIPASNSVMARNLFHLGILLDREEWKNQAIKMCSQLARTITSETVYMSHWGILFSEITKGMAEVVIVGKEMETVRKELHKHFLPFALTLGTPSTSTLALLKDRGARDERTRIYVCYNKTCKLPVETVKEALQQLQ